MKKIVNEIKLKAKELELKTDQEIDECIQKIKRRQKNESLDNILTDWFALVQESSFRTIGLKHFDVQLAAGYLLHNGKIVEMKTGEGKTLVSTLPVALNALNKKGVHVVTVNDYLAQRDENWMGKVYNRLGLTSGLVKSTSNIEEKSKNYLCDITYLTNSEVVFDYLRDCSAFYLDEIVQRPFDFCLIDEIDSVLIDEARTPLILSSFKETENLQKLQVANFLARTLKKEIHFQIDEKRKDINLTEEGYKLVSQKLGKATLYDPNDPWILEILNGLKANFLFTRNKDYIILKQKIVIVDEFTGRIMEDRRWSMGLHEAIEIKEGVPIAGGTKTKSSITYQNFFTLYPKLAGMTGTAKTTEKEFQEIYNLNVVVLPTAKPLVRKDLPDLVYQTEFSKWKQVLKEAKSCFEKGQPILIGTSNIEKSEFLSELFQTSNIPHQLLNAKPENVTRESEIVAQAGRQFAVTIATNMAGRGTDIILGGNLQFQTKQKILDLLKTPSNTIPEEYKTSIEDTLKAYENKNSQLLEEIKDLPYSLEICDQSLKNVYEKIYNSLQPIWEKENENIKKLGGLFVLGTERHETRRIDNQLRGRSGRQGDPGISQFFVSLDDELIKIFGGDNIKRWVNALMQDDDSPLQSNLLTNSLEKAQKKVESYNYDMRKNVFQYDEILNGQRKEVFQVRTEILDGKNTKEFILRGTEITFNKQSSSKEVKTIFSENLQTKLDYNCSIKNSKHPFDSISTNSYEVTYEDLWIGLDLNQSFVDSYQEGFLQGNFAQEILEIFDNRWTNHLERMSYIRETINLRSYGQQNPLIEYNFEALDSYKILFEEMQANMLYCSLTNPIN